MNFKIKDLSIDLGTTPIENIFINTYFSLATGDAIKVYIYVYKLAYEKSDQKNLSVESLAQELDLSPSQVREALDFWLEQGLLVANDDSYTLMSMRELILGIETEEDNKSENEDLADNEDYYLEGDLSLTKMFAEIEEILTTKLTPNEIQRIIDHIEEYQQERELVSFAFTYSDKTTSKRNVNYVLSILRNWAIDGIKTKADYEKSQEERKQGPKRKAKKKTSPKKDDRLSSDEIQDLLMKKLQADIEGARNKNE